MKSMALTILIGACALFLTPASQAQEIKGPTQFNLAILDQDSVSLVCRPH